jgi:hypothetical protein
LIYIYYTEASSPSAIINDLIFNETEEMNAPLPNLMIWEKAALCWLN